MFNRRGRALMEALNRRTPTQLPPATLCSLGELFGASISLDAARRISHIETSGSSYRPTRFRADGSGYTDPNDKEEPHYFVDIWLFKPDGDTHILRSASTTMTKRQARDCNRDITRKIALFLFENKDTPAQKLIALPSGAEEREDVAVSRR